MTAPQQKTSELVSRGLAHYGEGRLREAIGEWERALALSPDHAQAREYLTYVRENYDALKSEFDQNGRLTLGDFQPGAGSGFVRAETAGVQVEVDVDDGWGFEDDDQPFAVAEPTKRLRMQTEPESSRSTMEMGSGLLGELTSMGLARPGDGAAGEDQPFLDLAPAGVELSAAAETPAPREPPAQASPFDGLELDEPAVPDAESPFDGLELGEPEAPGGYDRGQGAEIRSDQEVTVQRRIPLDFSDIGLAGDDDGLEPETVQRYNPIDFTNVGLGPSDGDQTAEVKLPPALELQEPEEPLAEPPRSKKFLAEPPPTLNIRPPEDVSSRAKTSELLLDRPTTEVALRAADGSTMTPMEAMRRDISAAVDHGTSADEGPGERIRRRVERLIERALAEHQRGRGQLAVVAANLALDEAPASVVAQKLLHGHKRELERVFASYLGSLEQVPVLARPLTELGSGIDSRDAFLLTQVDGLLSLSDIVDVSGMPSLDAHRLLCRLLIDGIILLG